VHGGGNATFGHHGMGLAKKRLADDEHAGAALRCRDRAA